MDIKELAEKTRSEIIETHISWILLGETVLKIKKPVKFSFLDFSTLERRKFFCDEEVRLNSRTSPEVYLGVIGIDGRGEFCDMDSAEEFAVKMKRLDESRKMWSLLKNQSVTEAQIAELANAVAAFHKKAERIRGEFNSPKMIGSQVADLGGFRETIEKATGLGKWVDRILERSLGFIKRNESLIRKRQVDGFVRDCHGDLHSQNVFFQDGLKIIDCIEFSEDFRCIDVASDLAFMAMDLEFFGRDDLADRLVREYLSETGDDGLEALLPFYKCYRANVRAKIAAIEWMQKPASDARERIDRYVLMAERYSKSLI
jgi:hypothetical protein